MQSAASSSSQPAKYGAFTGASLIWQGHNVLSNLVYAASGHDVVLTMVRGQILYNAGKFPTLDLAGALKELHDYAIPKVFSDDSEEAPK